MHGRCTVFRQREGSTSDGVRTERSAEKRPDMPASSDLPKRARIRLQAGAVNGQSRLKSVVRAVDILRSGRPRSCARAPVAFPEAGPMNQPALHLPDVDDPYVKPRLHVLPRRAAVSEEMAPPDVAWEPPLRGRSRPLESWSDYMAFASRVVGRFHGQFHFER